MTNREKILNTVLSSLGVLFDDHDFECTGKVTDFILDERQKVLAEVESWLVDLPEKWNGVTQEDNILINKDRAKHRAKVQKMKGGGSEN